MGLLIFSGIALTVTPYIAEQFFPADKTSVHLAKPEEVAQALSGWFGTAPNTVKGAQGINQVTAEATTAWFAFGIARPPVEHFIRQYGLQQQPLTPEVLQETFASKAPPANWWQPASLGRETYFTGSDDERNLALIYNAELQRAFLVTRTLKKAAKF